jgi:hypothetical protein
VCTDAEEILGMGLPEQSGAYHLGRSAAWRNPGSPPLTWHRLVRVKPHPHVGTQDITFFFKQKPAYEIRRSARPGRSQ